MLVPGNSNLIFRRFELKAGEIGGGHSHNYDHAMLVVQGSVRVRGRRIDNDVPVGDVYTVTLTAGNLPLLVRKDWHHDIEATADSIYYCVFAARDDAGNVVDQWNGNMDAAT